jgi:hypothetical protein
MADDTRQNSQSSNGTPKKSYVDFYSTQTPSPVTSSNSNSYASSGASQNTAGAHNRPDATVIDAVKTIQLRDFSSIAQKPCARDALIFGMSAGFAIGGGRAVFGSKSQPIQ